jgi:hypothetical protein
VTAACHCATWSICTAGPDAGRFDVIAITDHILMQRDLLARAGRLLSLGREYISADQPAEDILRAIP